MGTIPNNSKSVQTLVSSEERKFNIVVFGTPECESSSSQLVHTSEDLNSVSKTFSTIDCKFNDGTIRDCFRLGKYHKITAVLGLF